MHCRLLFLFFIRIIVKNKLVIYKNMVLLSDHPVYCHFVYFQIASMDFPVKSIADTKKMYNNIQFNS